MTTNHTPGPWDALVNREGQNNTVRANGRVICELPGFGNPWVLENNARLIAAAPDMLAVLEKIATEFAGKQAGDIARAAIARAKGEA